MSTEFATSTGLEVYNSAEKLAIAYQLHAPRILALRDELLEEIDKLNSVFKACDVSAQFSAKIDICGEDEHNLMPREMARTAWRSIIDRMGIRKYMGKAASSQLSEALRSGSKETLPEITPENVENGIMAYAGSVNTFLQENIAEVYKDLKPWRSCEYKTNAKNRWALSNKIILTFALEHRYGSRFQLSYGDKGDLVQRLETIFRLLDGKGFRKTHNSEIGDAISTAASGETTYFKYRCFDNRNLHLTFKRQDLVDLFNQIAGNSRQLRGRDSDPFGAIRPEDFDQAPAKCEGYDLFETPADVAKSLVNDYACVEPGERVLEPSCGPGRIVSEIVSAGASCTAIDIQSGILEHKLSKSPAVIYHPEQDFLSVSPNATGLFHHVIMNPPFSGKRDVRFVMHGWKFVAAGGSLTAIMSAGVKFRTDKASTMFRQWVSSMRGTITDLPAGTFRDSGTNVNTVIVHIRCPEKSESLSEK